jgi:hypothetical protein
VTEDIKGLMEESPVPDNHGRAVASYVNEEDGVVRTSRDLAGRMSTMSDRGFGADASSFGIVSGHEDGGLVAHRGVLHPDEYVDFFALRDAVEAELGFSYAAVAAAYKTGRPTAEQRQLREKIDARLLALSRAGGNMEQLAKAIGVSEKALDRALARAREVDVQPMVKNAAVKARRVCFKTGEPGAKSRRRRFSQSPTEWVGTINLSDEEYAKGFDEKPGNPAYWAFRDRLNAFTVETRPLG